MSQSLTPGPLPAEEPTGDDVPSAEAVDYREAIALLRAAIEQEMEAKDLPALSIAVVDGDRIVWAEGFGFVDPKSTIRAKPETVYRVGSISKLFTDLALMKLVERGEIDLEAPVTNYLPEFAPQNPFDRPVTLRALTSHHSGLVRESPVGNYFDDSEPTLAETVASLNRTALVYPPGEKTKYSNAGIAVLGAVLERKTGVPYDRWMTREILEPLGMRRSGFVATEALKRDLATGWMWTYDGRRFEAPPFALGTAPAGNLYSDVLDLAKFVQFLFETEPRASAPVQPETLRQMMTLPEGKDEGFGIGFHVRKLDGEKLVGHGGAVYGFATELMALPERKAGVVVATSLDCANGVAGRLGEYALRLVLAARKGEELPSYQVTSAVPAVRARELVGVYQGEDGFVEVTELSGGGLSEAGAVSTRGPREAGRSVAGSGRRVRLRGGGEPERAGSADRRFGEVRPSA
jgi:CubicO group peptidase (beta-lactamase class C family)